MPDIDPEDTADQPEPEHVFIDPNNGLHTAMETLKAKDPAAFLAMLFKAFPPSD